MTNIPSLPKTQTLPALTFRPVGVEIYTDLLRSRRFLRLFFRRRDVTQAKALAFVGELIAALSAAGLVLTADVEVNMSLDNIEGKGRAMQSRSTRVKALNVKVQVQPAGETQADVDEWADWLRSQWVPQGGDEQAEGGEPE